VTGFLLSREGVAQRLSIAHAILHNASPSEIRMAHSAFACGGAPRGLLSLHRNIESSLHCNIGTAMQHGMIPCALKGGQPMVQYSRLSFVAVAAAFCVIAASGAPAIADDTLTNLGPVGPREPILVKVGEQRFIAFFAPERGECAVTAVTWKDPDPDEPYSSARVRVSLKPGQFIELDGPQRKSMGLLCGADASSLTVTAPAELILTGSTDTRK
jgi:hypothetical protein